MENWKTNFCLQRWKTNLCLCDLIFLCFKLLILNSLSNLGSNMSSGNLPTRDMSTANMSPTKGRLAKCCQKYIFDRSPLKSCDLLKIYPKGHKKWKTTRESLGARYHSQTFARHSIVLLLVIARR